MSASRHPPLVGLPPRTPFRGLGRAFALLAPGAAALLLAWPAPGTGETPVLPPSGPTLIHGDTLPPPAPLPDTLVGRIVPDTLLPRGLRRLPGAEDSPLLQAVAREPLPPDEERVLVLPLARRPLDPGWERGVWEWDRDELQNVRAWTLAELLDKVPGITLLRGGDYGQPTAATAFGLDPGRIRIFRDGMELPPLDGGVVDLSRVGIAALESVRVERHPGELRVELESLRLSDPRPYTLLEVGTGDLNTNLFRGSFGHPSVGGGHLVFALDRVDTQGPARQEPGASFGVFVGYTLFRGERGGLVWDLRRLTSRRPEGLWPPRNVNRSDWSLRGNVELLDGVVGRAFHQRSSLGLDPEVEPQDPAWLLVNQGTRHQTGLDLALDRDHLWARAGARWQGGEGWPGTVQRVEVGGRSRALGGAAATLEREGWDERSATRLHARAWTRPVLGVSLFAEVDDGARGVRRFVPPPLPELPEEDNGDPDPPEPPEPPEPLPPISFTDRLGLRAGAEVERGEFRMGVAGVRVRADFLHPTGLPLDRGADAIAGGTRNGVEVSGSLPLSFLLPGLAIEGWAQFWEEGGEWSYLPRHNHAARIRFHDVFLESRNLEVWADVGVRGRDGMTVFVRDGEGEGALDGVPSYQSWYARIQVRVVTARVFVDWENFTVRDGNRDFPDRFLFPTRTVFGVRWTLWN